MHAYKITNQSSTVAVLGTTSVPTRCAKKVCQQVCQHSVPTSVPTMSVKKQQFLLYEGFQKELNPSTVGVFFSELSQELAQCAKNCANNQPNCAKNCANNQPNGAKKCANNQPTVLRTVLTKCAKNGAKIVGTVHKKGDTLRLKPLGKAPKQNGIPGFLLRCSIG